MALLIRLIMALFTRPEIGLFHPTLTLRKHSDSDYIRISEGIYSHQREYVPALSFQQELELGEGGNSAEIS